MSRFERRLDQVEREGKLLGESLEPPRLRRLNVDNRQTPIATPSAIESERVSPDGLRR